MARELEIMRTMRIVHGGTIRHLISVNPLTYDPLAEFRKDPMTVLQTYAKEAGYRMLDLFKEFDLNGDFIITKEEFEIGIKV